MFRKLLSDYPFRKWIKASDGCEYCGAEYEVRVTYVDCSGCYGDVQSRIRHREDCLERFGEGEELDCAESTFDVAGWEFMSKPFMLNGREFLPLKSRANMCPCLNCGRLIIRVPLVLFIAEGEGGELDFCFSCFEERGLIERMVTKKIE
jgi:hypothetical protein